MAGRHVEMGARGQDSKGMKLIFFLFSFFITINSNAGIIERMAIVFHSPIPQKPPISPHIV